MMTDGLGKKNTKTIEDVKAMFSNTISIGLQLAYISQALVFRILCLFSLLNYAYLMYTMIYFDSLTFS